MKKKIGILFLLTALLSGAVAAAENVQLTDIINGTVTISGTADEVGEKINILIIENGNSPKGAELDESKVIYQSYAEADEDKKYSRSIKLDGGETGYMEYLVYTGSNKNPEIIVIATVDSKVSLAKQIVNGDKETIYSVLNEEASRKILGINSEYIKNAKLQEVAEKLVTALKDENFDFDNIDKNIVVQNLEKLNRIISEMCLVDCYNNKSIELFNGDEFLYNDILGLDLMENVSGYECYKEVLNSTGKKNVQSELTNQSFSDIEDLRKFFVKLTMFYGIHNDVNSGGYGHIADLFTDDNIDYAELDIPKYKKLSNKTKVHSSLISDNSLTLENFEEKIEKYSSITVTNTGNGSSGSGGTVSITPGAGSSAGSSGIKTEVQTVEKNVLVFSDLQDVSWAEEAILSLHERGIISGVGNSKFAPKEKLTREQAVKIVCTMNNYEDSDVTVDFEDVDRNAWYAPFIAQGLENGIVTGISEKEFGVGKNITRQDFVTLIYRTLEKKEEFRGVLGFSDSGSIAEYAQEAVGYFVDSGVIAGYPDNTFAPNANITRAEAAKIIYELVR